MAQPGRHGAPAVVATREGRPNGPVCADVRHFQADGSARHDQAVRRGYPGETMTTQTDSQRVRATPDRWPTVVLIALGAALAMGATLGPLLIGAIEWRISANSLNQTYGADGAALLLLAPTALVAAWLAWRARPLAAPLA